MKITHSTISRRSMLRQAAMTLLAVSLALLEGCATNAPSCDGRFEPINLPAPVATSAGKAGITSESDQDHE